MLRAYHVFNVEQTEECRLKPLPELVHATGHPKRLHRFEPIANDQFLHGRTAVEELVVGMGSAMLSAHAGTGGAPSGRGTPPTSGAGGTPSKPISPW